MGVYEKLIAVQEKLKAPKNQYNKFGKYYYRNAEDILEAVKPLCAEQKAVIFISDRPMFVDGRFYIEATAVFQDIESEGRVSVCAYAREDESKKGMDGSQITGATSSYARKYALNGLLCVDDGKDADSLPPDNDGEQSTKKPEFQRVDPLSDNKPLICENCGKPILTTRKKGEIFKTADEIIKFSREAFSSTLCYYCVQELLKHGDA